LSLRFLQRQDGDFDLLSPIPDLGNHQEKIVSRERNLAASRRTILRMPWGLRRFQEQRCLHFLTFSCSQRTALLGTPERRDIFLQTFEQARRWYGFYVTGYVVMPEHVHLLLSEPERKELSVALQMLKQNVARQLREPEGGSFWQPRYYDFCVWSEAKRIEKLRYIHRNPVRRGLASSPEEWEWRSFRHYLSGVESVVEIESQWTARKREQLGIVPRITEGQSPRPVSQTTRDQDGAASS
jgi:putative transposase